MRLIPLRLPIRIPFTSLSGFIWWESLGRSCCWAGRLAEPFHGAEGQLGRLRWMVEYAEPGLRTAAAPAE